jgi:uncharacterized membrane protein
MNKNRLESFSDGVISIIITIMVLEIKMPDTADWQGLKSIYPFVFSYLLSFAFVGIYWLNHHHLLQMRKRVTPMMIWANLNFLFWLSLVPFTTRWMDNSNFAQVPVASYAVILLLCGASYNLLSIAIYKSLPDKPQLKKILHIGWKEILSLVLYSIAIPTAFYNTKISILFFVITAVAWIIPSKKIAAEIEKLEH